MKIQKRALDYGTTKNLVIGGVEAGAGLAALGALYDYVRSAKRKDKAIDGAAEEGDTLELVVPVSNDKRAVVNEYVAAALAGGGTYLALRELINSWRKKELQQEVRDAQTGYIEDLTIPAAKEAASPFTLKEIAYDSVRDILLMSALAGGAGTYGILANTFPKVSDKSQTGKIKRIKIRGYGSVIADGPGDGPIAKRDASEAKKKEQGEEPEETDTPARRIPFLPSLDFSSLYGSSPISKAASELTFTPTDSVRCAKLLCQVLTCGSADKSASLLSGILGFVASEPQGLEELEKLAAAGRLLDNEAVFDAYGVVWDELNSNEKRAMISRTIDSLVMRPVAATLMLAELHEVHPTLAKLACTMASEDPWRYAALIKFGSIVQALDCRLENYMIKQSSMEEDASTDSDGALCDPEADKPVKDPIDELLNPE